MKRSNILQLLKMDKNGYASRGTQSTYETLSELTVQYNKTLFKDHNFTLLGGYSWMKSGYEDYWCKIGIFHFR